VTIAAEARADVVRFAVTDTGAGIEADHLDRVFDRFWRGDDRRERGAGLGLAVAKGIIEAHGGEIGVASRVGQGSTFYFTLRAHASRPRDENGEAPSALAPARSERSISERAVLG
jgi:signal transduction histidine kinase